MASSIRHSVLYGKLEKKRKEQPPPPLLDPEHRAKAKSPNHKRIDHPSSYATSIPFSVVDHASDIFFFGGSIVSFYAAGKEYMRGRLLGTGSRSMA